MRVQTGNGSIPLLTLIAIWSISLVVNLPGLAISPVLDKLSVIFPHSTELEEQLLTVLPNLFIIPFILLSGKLSVARNKLIIIVVGLVIYLVSGILYFMADSMVELIVISCLLGIGCGVLIPLAAGLIADVFTGKYRMVQLGVKSGIANASLVVSTLLVGVLAKINWHLPFIVYMIPIVPLLLTVFLRNISGIIKNAHKNKPKDSVVAVSKNETGKLFALIGVYGFFTYSVVIVSYYLPYITAKHDISSSMLGFITSMFFVAIVIPGFFLRYVIKMFGHYTILIASVILALGLGLTIVSSSVWQYSFAMFLIGAGYGVVQPIVYDKTATISPQSQATLYMSYVLATNYIAVTVTPFVVDLFKSMFNADSETFPFVLNFVLMICFIVVVVIFSKRFIFKMDNDYVG